MIAEWKCQAPHCKGKTKLPKLLRRVYQCSGCHKRYHTGCSGGAPYTRCDECWSKENRQ